MDNGSGQRQKLKLGLIPSGGERRRFWRRQFYITDGARCEVTTRHGMVQAFVVDLDPRGLRLAVPRGKEWSRFEEGNKVEVVIESPTAISSEPIPSTIRSIGSFTNDHGEFLSVGLHLEPSGASELARARRSGFAVYRCPEFFRPIAFCNSPFFLNEVIHFQIAAVKPNGLVALTSLRNQGLFPGMTLALQLMVPNLGEYRAAARILEVKAESTAAHSEVEMALIDPDPELQAGLGEFVMSFAKGVTIRVLHDQGFFLDTIYRAIRVATPANESDWEAICDLRLKAYQSVGKFRDKTDARDTMDVFDRYSRQIIARIGDRVVGAARVVFCGTNLQRSEHNALGIEIPEAIAKAGFVEFSRFCTDPEFRGGDIFVALMRQATLVTITAKMPYIVANCNSDLWSIYRKLGFRPASKPFEAFGRKDCRLIYCDAEKTILGGRKSGIVTWNQTVLPVTRFAALDNRSTIRNFHPWIALQLFLDALVAKIRLGKNHRRFLRRQRRRSEKFTGARSSPVELRPAQEPLPTSEREVSPQSESGESARRIPPVS
jgi:predicted GNAT family N-acyltransferase